MQAVSDATPLIHLSKISKVSYLKKLFGAIFIPKEIFEEIVIKGKEFKKKERQRAQRSGFYREAY